MVGSFIYGLSIASIPIWTEPAQEPRGPASPSCRPTVKINPVASTQSTGSEDIPLGHRLGREGMSSPLGCLSDANHWQV